VNISAADPFFIIFGKIQRWFAEMKALAFSGSAADIIAGTLAAVRGGTGRTDGKVSELATSRNFRTNLASTATAGFTGAADCNPGVTGTLPAGNGGTGRTDGKVAALATSRNMRTDLGKTASSGYVAFDGTGNADLGVTGTLPVAQGGTGQTSLQAVRNAMGLGNTTGALPVAQGGTGATNLETLKQNMGLKIFTGRINCIFQSVSPNGGEGWENIRWTQAQLDVIGSETPRIFLQPAYTDSTYVKRANVLPGGIAPSGFTLYIINNHSATTPGGRSINVNCLIIAGLEKGPIESY